jgi:hypothetical protein
MMSFYGPTLSTAARLAISDFLVAHGHTITDRQDCVIEVIDSEAVVVITDREWIRPERIRTSLGLYPFIAQCVVNGQVYPRDASPMGLWHEVFEYRRQSVNVDL